MNSYLEDELSQFHSRLPLGSTYRNYDFTRLPVSSRSSNQLIFSDATFSITDSPVPFMDYLPTSLSVLPGNPFIPGDYHQYAVVYSLSNDTPLVFSTLLSSPTDQVPCAYSPSFPTFSHLPVVYSPFIYHGDFQSSLSTNVGTKVIQDLVCAGLSKASSARAISLVMANFPSDNLIPRDSYQFIPFDFDSPSKNSFNVSSISARLPSYNLDFSLSVRVHEEVAHLLADSILHPNPSTPLSFDSLSLNRSSYFSVVYSGTLVNTLYEAFSTIISSNLIPTCDFIVWSLFPSYSLDSFATATFYSRSTPDSIPIPLFSVDFTCDNALFTIYVVLGQEHISSPTRINYRSPIDHSKSPVDSFIGSILDGSIHIL